MAYIGKVPANAPLTSSDIADGIISTADIANTAVTGAKVNTDVISAQTALGVAPADTDEFLVSDAGVIKRIDYSLIKGGGAYELLQTQTVSSAVGQVDFTSTYLTTAYRDYRIIISNTTPANDNVDFQMRFSSDGGSSFHDGGDHGFANAGVRSTENSMLIDTLEDQSSFKLNCVQYLGSDTGETSDWIIDFFDPLNQQTDNQYLQYYVRGTWMDGGPASNSMFGSGTRKHTSYANAVVNGIRFFMSAGNIEAGNYSLYGRKI